MRKPNLELKEAKLLVEESRLAAQEAQYTTLNTKVKQVYDRLTKKRELVESLKNEIADAQGTVNPEDIENPTTVS